MPNENNEDADKLGGRLPLADPQSLSGPAKEVYDRIMKKAVPQADAAGFKTHLPDGRLIGPFNLNVFSPEIGGAFLDLQAVEGKNTALSERQRQIVILTVGSIWKSPYELYAHEAVARQAGFDKSVIDALATGRETSALSEDERTAQRFTRQLVADRWVDAETYQTAQSALGHKGLVDMIILAGCYMTVCSLLNAFEIPAPQS